MSKRWTQDMKDAQSKRIKRAWRMKKGEAKKSVRRRVQVETYEVKLNEPSETQVAYAFGHEESWLENYARRNGISFASLARRVGQLLYHAPSRKVLRSDD